MARTPHNRPRPAARFDEPLRIGAEERERLKRDYWRIYASAARDAFLMTFPDPRTPSGFPVDFHLWRAAWRRAWLAGYDQGFHDRLRYVAQLRHQRGLLP
jgi:hypothetical protein